MICLYLLLVTLKWEASTSCRLVWNKTAPFYGIKTVQKSKKLSTEKQGVHLNYSGLSILTFLILVSLVLIYILFPHNFYWQLLMKEFVASNNNRASNCSPLNHLQDLDCSLYKLLNISLQLSLYTSAVYITFIPSFQTLLEFTKQDLKSEMFIKTYCELHWSLMNQQVEDLNQLSYQ